MVITVHFCWDSKWRRETPNAKVINIQDNKRLIKFSKMYNKPTRLLYSDIPKITKTVTRRRVTTEANCNLKQPPPSKTLEYCFKHIFICHFCCFSSNPQSSVTLYLPTICFSDIVSGGIQIRDRNKSKSERCK